MAEDEVVPLKGRDGLAPKAVPDEPVPTPADRTTAAALDAVGVDVAEGGPLGAGLDGGAGEAVAREAALSVALAPLQCGPTGLLVNGFSFSFTGFGKMSIPRLRDPASGCRGRVHASDATLEKKVLPNSVTIKEYRVVQEDFTMEIEIVRRLFMRS